MSIRRRMKTLEAYNLLNFLNNISKQCIGKLGYAVARNIRVLNTELTEFQNERNELIRKYGTKEGDNIFIEAGSEAFFKFQNEMKQYESLDLDIPLMKVDREVLEGSDLSADILLVLSNYMEKGDQE